MSQQKTEEWLLQRLGHVTGSRFGDIVAVGAKGQPLKSRETTIVEITLELLTGRPGPMWTSKATDWGNEHEPTARMMYEARTGSFCEEVGFITHEKHMQVGCSPDGLLDDNGGYESKCPYTPAVHLETLLHGMPKEHAGQVQGGMWICKREYWDFVSFHPQFPDEMQLYIERIERDDKYIAMLEEKVLEAVHEINKNVRDLLEKYSVIQ